MEEILHIEEITVQVTRKAVRRFNLRVHRATGQVSMSIPRMADIGEAAAFARDKLAWIRAHLADSAPESHAAPDAGGEYVRLGELLIPVLRRPVKVLRLEADSLRGQVSLRVPLATPLAEAEAFATQQEGWIRRILAKIRPLQEQANLWNQPRLFAEGELCWLWGRRHTLHVEQCAAVPAWRVEEESRRIVLCVPAGVGQGMKAALLENCYRAALATAIPPLIARWEAQLQVRVTHVAVRAMKSRWGSCSSHSGRIRLNLELAKRRPDALDYVILHELTHLHEANHSPRFYAILDQAMPNWREISAQMAEPLE